MSFQGKTAIVTGASAGIGREISLLLAQKGADVVLVDIRQKELEELQSLLKENGCRVMTELCDVADEARVQEVTKKVLSNYGKIDILVNNAGIYRTDIGLFVQSDSSIWKKKIDVNILGTMYFTRAVLDSMIQNQYGRIINIGSVAGVYGIQKMVDYSMTKGAVIAFTTAVAKEVAPFGITVNTVSPGNINADATPEADHPWLSYMNRSGSVRECANVVLFLASDEASFVSGSNYIVDGSRKSI